MIRLEGTRFGTLEFQEEDIITIMDGMIGFNAMTRYVLVPAKADSPFSWLQSLEEPKLAFLVADPNAFVADYLPTISDFEAKKLELTEDDEHVVLVTTNIPAGKPEEATINLAAPIIINVRRHMGRQLVLENSEFAMKHRICEPKTSAQPVAA